MCRHGHDVIGYEILRRVRPSEVPGFPLDPSHRGVLGTYSGKYLVPPGIDLLELGLIDSPGAYHLLPIDSNETPLWDAVIDVIVSEKQAKEQRKILFRSYDALHDMIVEADELEANITEWSQHGKTHPIFGLLRLEIIEVWKLHRGNQLLSERHRAMLHARVAQGVARKIGAHVMA